MPNRLLTVGDLVVDILLDVRLPVNADDHQMSPTLLLEPGGACSTILAARNLGMDVAALGAVGADFQGRMLREIMAGAGVDISALQAPAGSTTTTVIALAGPGRRRACLPWRLRRRTRHHADRGFPRTTGAR